MGLPRYALRLAILVLVAVHLNGCVETSFNRYPSHWAPALSLLTYCPDLTGVYRFHGDVGEHPELDGMETLDPFVNYSRVDYNALQASTHVQMQGPISGKLLISFWNGSSLVYETEFADGAGFRCDGRFVAIIRPGQKDGRLFTRAEDGALLSHVRYVDGLAAGLLLSLRVGTYWTRWARIAPNSSLQADASKPAHR